MRESLSDLTFPFNSFKFKICIHNDILSISLQMVPSDGEGMRGHNRQRQDDQGSRRMHLRTQEVSVHSSI